MLLICLLCSLEIEISIISKDNPSVVIILGFSVISLSSGKFSIILPFVSEELNVVLSDIKGLG